MFASVVNGEPTALSHVTIIYDFLLVIWLQASPCGLYFLIAQNDNTHIHDFFEVLITSLKRTLDSRLGFDLSPLATLRG